MTNGSPSVRDLILVPSIITLAVTILRLVGELRGWNEVFFGRAAGGGGAVVGISWLAILFGVYFALRLRKAGQAFQSSGKAIGLSVLALALFVGGTMLLFAGGGSFKVTWKMAAGLLVILVSIWVMRVAWPVYWNVMMTYALAARIPVLIVMYLALQGNWNTHYDAVPPNVTYPDLTAKFMALGLIPQLFFWIPFTVIACGLLGTITAAIRKAPARVDVS
jgi:hypothetical protein